MRQWKRLLLINFSLGLVLAIAIPCIPIQPRSISAQTNLVSILDNRVAGIMKRQNIPGMAVVVIRDGVVEFKGYGVKDLTTKQPVKPNTAFAIGSITKPFTAMAIMMLLEEGKLNLDEPIDRYLKNLPEDWTSPTLRQLLSHTSGISEDFTWHKIKQRQDFIEMAGKEDLDFPTGDSWSYSNSGFYLAGLIIERVSGQTYEKFMRDRIFQPLGMQHTQAKLAPVINLATGYEWDGENLQKMDLDEDRFVYAAGNIISTASDMAKWVQAIDRGQLLNASSYQQLWTAATLKNGRSTGYGLGWFVDSFKGHPYIEHSGNVSGYSSVLYRYPQDRLDVIVLINNSDVNITGSLVANAIAGVYEPNVSLVGLSPQIDPNPEFTQKFLSLLQGNDRIISFTPEFQLQLKTRRGKFLKNYLKAFRQIEKLEFLHREAKNGDTKYYYKTSLQGKPIYAFVEVTKQQEIAYYVAAYSP
jgi:D-alanyl-D-alanine carboxypeptidase